MNVGMYFKRTTRGATAFAFVLLSVAGCDRSTPEKLVKQEIVTNPQTSDATTDPSNADPSKANPGKQTIIERLNEQTLFGGNDPATLDATTSSDITVDHSVQDDSMDKVDLSDRTFMTLQPIKTDRPVELVAHLNDIDVALRDLILAGANKIVGADTFNSSGMRLGTMKLNTGEKLAASPDATEEQRKLGTVSQLVALSHMSGLKDIESAKKLEKFAGTLLQSSDPDLAHQGRVVLLGFRLQDLQNGNVSEPTQLLADLDGLFQRPSDAGFPEMMVLQQAQSVLSEMGFNEAATKIDELVVSKFMDSPDPQLSSTAWNLATEKSQAFGNYNASLQDVYDGKEKEPTMLLGAVRGLYSELPNSTTLLQLVNLSTDLEYRGLVNIASELSDFIKTKLASLPNSTYVEAITTALEAQGRRLGIRGQALNLELDGLVDLEGAPLKWSDYKGKVVLIDFWATWCKPCLLELPNIRKAREDFGSQGFEVLAINMDENLAEAKKNLSTNPLPWKTFHSSDLSALGFKSAVAKRLGINAIPFLVLLDTEGKVAAVHVRGDRIAPSVRSLLADGLSN